MSENTPPTARRDELQGKANTLRKERDRLNDEARAHAEERDTYNAKVRGLVNEANEHKKRRDEQNESVRRQKGVRDEANRIADEAAKAADALRRERSPGGGDDGMVNVPKLEREARQLEYKQMTQVLKPAEERALVDRLQEIGRLIKQKKVALKADPELKASIEKAEQLKEKAEKEHSRVGEIAEKAQAEHDAMIQLYKQSDKLRKVADKLQEKFVVSKMEADKVHKAYIEIVNQIHEIEDGMAGTGGRRNQQVSAKEAEAAADEVFEKFKSGEKLSTEDLLTLQKAGLL
ncbi:MAG: coiled-coil protein [Thermoplasmatota archaeon]